MNSILKIAEYGASITSVMILITLILIIKENSIIYPNFQADYLKKKYREVI
ncbi:hypothetical protein RhiirC2_758486, partial [Rhizophagus irregularis]